MLAIVVQRVVDHVKIVKRVAQFVLHPRLFVLIRMQSHFIGAVG